MNYVSDVELMLEIEMKFRVENAESYEKLLKELLDASFGEEFVERDEFFRCDALGFPNEGKMLRIRRRGSFLAATFKGPRIDDSTKSREELELPLVLPASVDSPIRDALVDRTRREWTLFFSRLGFEPKEFVEKTRRRSQVEYGGRRFEISLDVLEGLGSFTEIETMAHEVDFEEARDMVKELAERLGLRDSITKSYLALKIESATGAAVEEK